MLSRLSPRARRITMIGAMIGTSMMASLTFYPVRRVIPFAFFDCCMGDFCCPSCCFLVSDCNDSNDCDPE